MTSSKLVFKGALVASLSLLLLASCTRRDAYLDNGGATFYVDSVTGSFTNDGLTSNDVVTRKFINFTACVKDNAQQAAIMSLQFQIKAGDVVITKSTDERGCLVWQELFSYDGTDDEKQVLLSRAITAIQSHSGTEVVQLAYDPWGSGDKLVFLKREAGRSATPVTINYQPGGVVTRKDAETQEDYAVTVDIRGTLQTKNLKRTDVATLILVDEGRDFSQYEIDQNLNLTIARQYLLKFSAGIVRRSFDKGLESDNINSGHFKIYFALLKEGFDATKAIDGSTAPFIVSANQVDAEATVGRIVQKASVRFNNVAALASRMTAVLTLVPTDPDSHFAETSFEGVLAPVTGSLQAIDLIPSKNLNAHQLLDLQATARAQQTKMRALDLFAQASGFTAMKTTPASVQGSSSFLKGAQTESYDLVAAFKKKKAGQALTAIEQQQFLKAVCFKFFDGFFSASLKPAYEQCLQQPDKMMNAVSRDFVEQVNNPVPVPVGAPLPESMTISSGLNFTQAKNHAKGNTTSTSMSLNAGLDAGLGFGLGGGGGKTPPKPSLLSFVPFKLGGSIGGKFSVGKEWYTTTGVVASQSDATTVSTVRGVTINSMGFAFNIDVTTRSCFLIAPTAALETAMGNNPHPGGRYFCADDVKRETRQEVYYFVNEASDTSNSPLGDNLSSQDNPWRMFIRGTPTFSLFQSIFGQKGIALQLDKLPEDDILKRFDAFYVTQEYPGMLTPLK